VFVGSGTRIHAVRNHEWTRIKPEIRDPKSEARNIEACGSSGLPVRRIQDDRVLRISAFGLLSDFGFRISGFIRVATSVFIRVGSWLAGPLFIAFDLAVAQANGSAGVLGNGRIVRDQDKGHALLIQVIEQAEDLGA